MNAVDFFSGIADFWTSPIKNFKFLHANSEGYRARVSQGFERDIRAATAKHGVSRISGRGSFTDWFLMQIRLADTFAVTQGMWSKYKAGLKQGLSQEEAIAEAEDTTNRTQPSFGIDTLSALQNSGSWFKLMTMFQNQPNKYFRITGDNLRNFKYGRGSRTKAASTILLTWVVLPMMFQFIADAFQWKPERQARAGILGPLNFVLIGGQLVQSIWGWLTDLPFDYQVSPVAQTLRDLQTITFKAKKLVNQGIDPYKDVSVDDVASLLEYLAKATGQVTGLPTPYFVQVERQIRRKLAEDEDINIKDFLFSGWSLIPPKKGSEDKVEELNLKLGEPEEGAEDKPLTEKPLPIYNTQDWFRDIGKVYKNVLPQDVLDDKGASKESKAWAEYEVARSQADILPDISLYKINTEDNEDTIFHYYQQWKARERMESLEELNEFDKQYPKAYLGNVTRQQYNLLLKYLESEDKDAFLEDHPELKVNPHDEHLKLNPTDNAYLALGGQAKILTKKAFDEFNRLVKELDIPEDAIPEFTLPPEGSIETHFAYEELVSEGRHNSWEAQLLLAKDNAYREWHRLKPIETPIESLELKTGDKYLEIYNTIADYKDEDSPLFIEDEDKRAEATKEIKLTTVDGKLQFRDVEDIVEALEKDATREMANLWVDRGRTIDEFSAGSSEAMVWLLDNKEVWNWALENDLLTDDGSDWNEPVLRINAQWREQDETYNALSTDDDSRLNYLENNEAYRKDRRRKDAFGLSSPDGRIFTEPEIENYVAYYELPVTGFRQERYLLDNPEFGEVWHEITGNDLPVSVPDVRYDELTEEFQDGFDKYDGFSDNESEHYIEDPDKRPEARRRMLIVGRDITDFGWADLERDAHKQFFPKQQVDEYMVYYSTLLRGKPSHWLKNETWYEPLWYLIDHLEFYNTARELKDWEVKDFREVPTRKVWDKYVIYKSPAFSRQDRLDYRAQNPNLDNWMLLAGKVTKLAGDRGTGADLSEQEEEAGEFAELGETLEEIRRLKELD